MKVTINNATGLMIESQSQAADDAALLANAVSMGFTNVAIRIVTAAEHSALIAAREAAQLAANPTLAKSTFIKQVDQDADTIIKSVMGERATEYLLAEQEATAFKAAGYAGSVPSSVSSEATAKGTTPTAACDSILATAAGWRTAQAALRAQRLLAKASASSAIDAATLDAVKGQWATFTVALKAQLGVA